MNFRQWLKDNWEEDNLCPPPLNAQEAINILEEYLLGEDWYIEMPLRNEQANVEIVHSILEKYCKRYRKEIKEEKRRLNKWKK